jgi:hypothetical protein
LKKTVVVVPESTKKSKGRPRTKKEDEVVKDKINDEP